jgi:cytidylate kinase
VSGPAKRARGIIVAIDGPAGAGKSTLSRRVAERVAYTLVDTGALYRAVALWARRRGIAWDDGPALGEMTSQLRFAFVDGSLEVDGERPGDALRTSETSLGASRVSAHPEVRAALLGVQRDMGRDGGVVLEGRDIGTVVYPDAELKIFLVASDEERAKRRLAELVARGEAATLEGVRSRSATRSTCSSSPRDDDGLVLLSKEKADKMKVWDEISPPASATSSSRAPSASA